MKITQRPASGLPDIGAPAPVGDVSEGESSTRGRASDRVELSSGARLRADLRRAIGDVGDGADATTDQVRALRVEVAAGTYRRDPAEIAQRFLADVAGELLS